MFEYVKLKNFKSLVNSEINLLNKDGAPKKTVLIYGRNGIGKSNLASAFFMLSETFRTMDVRDLMQTILTDKPESLDNETFQKLFKERYKDIETIINDNKTVSSSEPMYLEFGFILNGNKRGKYLLEMDNNQIIHERLEYVLTKNKGQYFDIVRNNGSTTININRRISKNKKAYDSILEACEKFWGKHSLISILFHETDDKTEEYIKENLSVNFKEVMHFFSKISCKLKLGNKGERGFIGLPPEMIGPFDQGEISSSKEEQLNKVEKLLNTFFKSVYPDVKEAFYDRKLEDDIIHYQLMFKKNIAGKVRIIDFSLESTGTQTLLDILPFMLVAVNGSVAIIDEYDMGIHDLLVKNTISSLFEKIKGQLILITHTTLLMDSKIPNENIYLIHEFENGKKNIKPITYNNKIHKNANVRNQYLEGNYSGVPEKTSIDFQQLYSILKEE